MNQGRHGEDVGLHVDAGRGDELKAATKGGEVEDEVTIEAIAKSAMPLNSRSSLKRT